MSCYIKDSTFGEFVFLSPSSLAMGTRYVPAGVDSNRLGRTLKVRVQFLSGNPAKFRDSLLNKFNSFGIPSSQVDALGQLRGSKDWFVTFRTEALRSDVLRRGEIYCDQLKSNVSFSSFSENVNVVRVHWLPYFVRDSAVAKFFAEYGEVKDVADEKVPNSAISTGVRRVTVDISPGSLPAIPYVSEVCGYPVLVIVPGRQPLCLRCSKTGHIRRDCNTEQCSLCRSFSHSASSCARQKNSYAAKVGVREELVESEPRTSDPPAGIYRCDSDSDSEDVEKDSVPDTSKSDMESLTEDEDTTKAPCPQPQTNSSQSLESYPETNVSQPWLNPASSSREIYSAVRNLLPSSPSPSPGNCGVSADPVVSGDSDASRLAVDTGRSTVQDSSSPDPFAGKNQPVPTQERAPSPPRSITMSFEEDEPAAVSKKRRGKSGSKKSKVAKSGQ